MGTDKYHIQVNHHLRVGKNALNEYDQYAIYLAILYHGTIDVFCLGTDGPQQQQLCYLL